MASDDLRPFDVFISYARADDVPAPGQAQGWVSTLRDQIEDLFEQMEGESLRIFFDRSDIALLQDWEARLSGALRQCKVLLVCVGPNYFKSAPCKWEWEHHQSRRAHLMGRVGLREGEAGSVAGLPCDPTPNGFCAR